MKVAGAQRSNQDPWASEKDAMDRMHSKESFRKIEKGLRGRAEIAQNVAVSL
jgi:hypothetical protein